MGPINEIGPIFVSDRYRISGGRALATVSTRKRNSMPAQRFAFPKERKEPLNDASHVRNAIARFNQVEGVSETEKAAAWRRIKSAAKRFGVEVETARPGRK
jgi:uncharacterized protein DUF6582